MFTPSLSNWQIGITLSQNGHNLTFRELRLPYPNFQKGRRSLFSFCCSKREVYASSQRYNLCNGNGLSVPKVIDTAIRVNGRPIAVLDASRHEGDTARLVANATLARQQLGWVPQFLDLGTIVTHARAWEIKAGS